MPAANAGNSPGRKPRERQDFPRLNRPSLPVERSPGATYYSFLPPLKRSQMLAPTYASRSPPSLQTLYFRGLDKLNPIYPLHRKKCDVNTYWGRVGRTSTSSLSSASSSACLKGHARTRSAIEAAGIGVEAEEVKHGNPIWC